MNIVFPSVVPELDVENLQASFAFYIDILGFNVVVKRPEESFAYLVREGGHLMIQEADGPGRRFRTAPLERPFGRGMNLQMQTSNAQALYKTVTAAHVDVVLALEEHWYRQGTVEQGLRQFVVADPDGYLLRFAQNIGSRPATSADLG